MRLPLAPPRMFAAMARASGSVNEIIRFVQPMLDLFQLGEPGPRRGDFADRRRLNRAETLMRTIASS